MSTIVSPRFTTSSIRREVTGIFRGISPVVPSEGEEGESICEGGGLMYVLKRINKRNAGIRKRTRFIEAPIRIVTNIFPNKGIVSTPDFGRNGFPAYGSSEIRRSGAGQSVPKDLFLSLKRYRPGSSLSLPGKGGVDAEQGGLRSDEELEFSFSLASFRGRGGQRHRGVPPL